jgi:hypothetical protein
MQPMYDAVHAAAPNNLVIVSGYAPSGSGSGPGVAGSYDVSIVCSKPPTGIDCTVPGHEIQVGGLRAPNVVYSSHPYTGGVLANCAATTQLAGPNDLDTIVKPVAQNYPVIFGEMGTTCGPQGAGTVQQGQNNTQGLLDYANANGLAGWTVFAWNHTFNHGFQNNQWNCPTMDYGGSFGIYYGDTAAPCTGHKRYEPSAYGTPVLTEITQVHHLRLD